MVPTGPLQGKEVSPLLKEKGREQEEWRSQEGAVKLGAQIPVCWRPGGRFQKGGVLSRQEP